MGSERGARRVAVLMGGRSSEAAISRRSGEAVLAALRRLGHDAAPVAWDQDLWATLTGGRFDCAFVALHGTGGEDGQIQGLLECAGIPYTGSGVLGSALAMDKLRTKLIWSAAGIPTPAHRVITTERAIAEAVAALGLPLVVKPADEGSSIGVAIVDTEAEAEAAAGAVRTLGRTVLAEQFVAGTEYTVSILAGKALPMIRLETTRRFYDYEAKYESPDTGYHCPCGLGSETESVLAALCLEAFAAVGGTGWGRVDFILDADGAPWLLEANTVPGMTDHSLVPMAAAEAGLAFDALVAAILDTAGLEGLPLVGLEASA